MAAKDWSSSQYLKFERERTQPAVDLAGRIELDSPKRIIDIGCGPGNSTQVLAEKYPDAYILGVDNSANMLEAARKNCPDLEFMLCDVSQGVAGLPKYFDVVFSNACIQWVPDHETLIPNLLGLLRPGGVLAVQTPMNYKEPIHTIIEELVNSGDWSPLFNVRRIFYNLSQGKYYDLLKEQDCSFDLWETTYLHQLDSHQAIMDWYRATGLRPYLDALPESLREEFESQVYRRVRKAYPIQQDGRVIFRFPRFFFTAVKNG